MTELYLKVWFNFLQINVAFERLYVEFKNECTGLHIFSSRSQHGSLCVIDLLWEKAGWISCNKDLTIYLRTKTSELYLLSKCNKSLKNSIQRMLTEDIYPTCPQRRSILHNGIHLDLLESICKLMHLFQYSTKYSVYIYQ